MIKRLVLLACLVAAFVPALPGQTHSSSSTAQYVAGPGGVVGQNVPNAQGAVGQVGLLGYRFPALPKHKYTKVKVFDEVAGSEGIGVLICGTTCTDDWQIVRCTNANGVISLGTTPRWGERISVNVLTISTGVLWAGEPSDGCPNVGVTGTITASFIHKT
ncbi:MAG TPA: hypothetical protein VGB83_11190 [Actinomycetota bacterium]